jgi:hypothetical protein
VLVRATRLLRRLYRLAADPELSVSYFPNEPRKNATQRFTDLLRWYLKHREVNEYYYCWGMDRVHGQQAADVLSLREVRTARDRRNEREAETGLSYVATMRDKYLFALMLKALDFPAPKLLALIRRDEAELMEGRRRLTLDQLRQDIPDFDGFCKPRFGMHGESAFALRITGGEFFKNDHPVSADEIAASAAHHVLEERVYQHRVMALLHPSSVNTLRVITVRDGDRPRVFSRPLVRFGNGGSVVDNGAAGGILVFTDPATGQLVGPALRKRGGALARHPDTNIAFDGHVIPFYARALELAEALHAQLPGLHSVGWDIAITEDGPVFIEGNHWWAAEMRQGREPDFKREFERLFKTS